MTTNPYAEAVEAAARAIGSRAACEHERAWIDAPARRYENCFDCDGRAAVAAAVGPLLAPLRAALESLPIQEDFQDDDGNGMPVHFAGSGMALYPADYVHALDGFAASVEQALDAIEAGATSEGGRDE